LGQPVESAQSISVIAPTAMASDFLSTALFVLGVQSGLSFINNLPGVEAMIVDRAGKQHFSPGWPAR
jgi:thiamine biosynthesis lipoprotein